MAEAPTPQRDPLTEPGPWNAIATGYDEEFAGRLTEFGDAVIALLAPSSSGSVLDVGTGPGTVTLRLAPHVGRVVAIDFAEEMIRRLREHLTQRGISNVEPHVMDGQALALPDQSFDSALSMFGLFLFSDRVQGLREMFRVLKPGGRMVTTSWSTADKNQMLGVGLEAIRTALPDLPRPPGPFPTQDPEICAAELRTAGFTDVSTKIVTASLEHESIEQYWRSFERAAAPLVLLKKKLGEAGWAAANARVLENLRGRFGSGRVTLQSAAIITTGSRPA